MNIKNILSILLMVTVLGGCSSASSSSVPPVPYNERTVGPVYITVSSIPQSIDYQVIGRVKANARKGYNSVESLYPLLAVEARKIGANAVINVEGGRTVSAFSWAAPFTSGLAIKIDDLDKLKKYKGKSY